MPLNTVSAENLLGVRLKRLRFTKSHFLSLGSGGPGDVSWEEDAMVTVEKDAKGGGKGGVRVNWRVRS